MLKPIKRAANQSENFQVFKVAEQKFCLKWFFREILQNVAHFAGFRTFHRSNGVSFP